MNRCPQPKFVPQGNGEIANWEEIHQWACANDTIWSRTVRDMHGVTTDEVKLLRLLAVRLLIIKDEVLQDMRHQVMTNRGPVVVINPKQKQTP